MCCGWVYADLAPTDKHGACFVCAFLLIGISWIDGFEELGCGAALRDHGVNKPAEFSPAYDLLSHLFVNDGPANTD